MPKATPGSSREFRRHNPLHEELAHDPSGRLRKVARTKRREKADRPQNYVDSAASSKILALAREQQDEIEAEATAAAGSSSAASFGARFVVEEEESDGDEEEAGDWLDYGDDDEEEIEIDAEDAALFDKFITGGSEEERGEAVSLADKILEKIAEAEARNARRDGGGMEEDGEDELGPALPEKVIEVYTTIGLLLKRYKSGKLPKAFKIIPSLKNWEELLYITRFDEWTPNAVYEATRLFVSQKSNIVQKFLGMVLLERVTDDIRQNKNLNVHLYNAIKKALYKPAAFFKGFLFPLASTGCTLREATIIGSVLTRISIPVLHSAAALLHLCEMPYSGPTSVFIKVLIDKKYALPYKVVDALVFHFMKFRTVEGDLPLLWHQSFLAFAQRYKNDITEDQRDVLLDTLLAKGHKKVGPEIRRELLEGRGRGEYVEVAEDGDVLMD